MLRNPILGDFSRVRGVCPSGSAHHAWAVSFHKLAWKTFSVNSLIIVIAIAYANMSYKIVLDLGNSLYKAPQFNQMGGDSQNSLLKSYYIKLTVSQW